MRRSESPYVDSYKIFIWTCGKVARMRVEFLSGGLKLAGLVDLPEGPARVFAVAAACFTCSKNSKTSAYLARGMAARGIGCLRLDFKGLGESEGEFVKNTLSSNVEDLLAGAEFLSREFSGPTLVIGHSFGGTAAVRAARRMESCRGVVVVNSPSDPKRITTYFPERLAEIRERGSAMVNIAGRPFPIGRDFLEDLERDDAERAVAELGKALLVCHATADEVVPIAQGERTFQWARQPKSFLAIPGADHFLSEKADSDYAAEVIAAWAGQLQ
jgi:alpha/beta superfamily hydrolase